MQTTPIETRRLKLVPQTLEETRAMIDGLSAEHRAAVSEDWLARLNSPTVDFWTLGFRIVQRETDAAIGSCGFKGPPDAVGMVEIAYSVEPTCEGKGFATEAAAALVAFAFSSGRVSTVRAHTSAEHNASSRVLTKCGFSAIGEVMDPEDGLVWRWERYS